MNMRFLSFCRQFIATRLQTVRLGVTKCLLSSSVLCISGLSWRIIRLRRIMRLFCATFRRRKQTHNSSLLRLFPVFILTHNASKMNNASLTNYSSSKINTANLTRQLTNTLDRNTN